MVVEVKHSISLGSQKVSGSDLQPTDVLQAGHRPIIHHRSELDGSNESSSGKDLTAGMEVASLSGRDGGGSDASAHEGSIDSHPMDSFEAKIVNDAITGNLTPVRLGGSIDIE